MKKHKYADLIHAWADGAIIEFFAEGDWKQFSENRADFNSAWEKLRVKPTCEYAFSKIRELAGEKAVEFYTYFLRGFSLELFEEGEWHTTNLEESEDEGDSPYEWFLSIVEARCEIRKKSKLMQEWAVLKLFPKTHLFDVVLTELDDDINEQSKGINEQSKDFAYLKTCLREIEVD